MTKSMTSSFQLGDEPQDSGETGRAMATQRCFPLPLLLLCSEASVAQLLKHSDHLCMLRALDSLLAQNILLKNCLYCSVLDMQPAGYSSLSALKFKALLASDTWVSVSEPSATASNSNKNQVYKPKCKCIT